MVGAVQRSGPQGIDRREVLRDRVHSSDFTARSGAPLFFGERLRKNAPAASPPVTLTYGSSLVWDRVKPGTTRGSIAYLGNYRQLDECKQKCRMQTAAMAPSTTSRSRIRRLRAFFGPRRRRTGQRARPDRVPGASSVCAARRPLGPRQGRSVRVPRSGPRARCETAMFRRKVKRVLSRPCAPARPRKYPTVCEVNWSDESMAALHFVVTARRAAAAPARRRRRPPGKRARGAEGRATSAAPNAPRAPACARAQPEAACRCATPRCRRPCHGVTAHSDAC